MKPRFSLFTKILLWFFLNLIVLVSVHLLLLNVQFRFSPYSALIGDPGGQMGTVARQIAFEIRDADEAERNLVLRHYSESFRVDFILFDHSGRKLAGGDFTLPPEVLEKITEPPGAPPPPQGRPPAGPPPRRPGGPPPFIGGSPGRRGEFMIRTSNPRLYWAGIHLPVFEKGSQAPIRSTLVARSDSITGHGFFFNPVPLLIVILTVLSVSFVLWFPFVRRITGSISEMTQATERIAEEKFDVRVDDRRSDELGRLGTAINHMAARLSGFVSGQKRFLGDVSHELNSPLARMQLALSILEERVDPANKAYVEDAQEEVRLMSRLVAELLSYTKAGMTGSEIELQEVNLAEAIRRSAEREGASDRISLEVPGDLTVLAHPDLLSRAIANVLRNSIRYAGDGGPIRIESSTEKDLVRLSISDNGPGVPPDALDKLFDPFYRIESDRGRETGGTGLGLAIVKSCIEACRGSVSARINHSGGLEIQFSLITG